MLKKIKKYFKGFSKFELTLLILSFILIFGSAVITKSGWLVPVTSFVGMLCALYQAKGKVIS